MTIRSSLLPAGTPPAAFGMIVLNESRIARRLPLGLLTGVALPLVLLVIIGNVPKDSTHLKVLGGLILLLAVAMTGFGVAAPKSAGGLALALGLSMAGCLPSGCGCLPSPGREPPGSSPRCASSR